jgi:hypothetical protein
MVKLKQLCPKIRMDDALHCSYTEVHDMLVFFSHFLIGIAGGLAIFFIFFRLSGASSTSAPFGLVFLGLACGTLALQLSPWVTPLILALYAGVSFYEHRENRR